MNNVNRFMRRVFDTAASAAGLLLISPLFAIIALAIKLDDGGTVLYGQWRVGRNFRPFRLLKFRTMVPNADRIGGTITAMGDPRVTRVGRFLRRYKLDELPQLWNVLCGDLGLVGARPEVERYVSMFRNEYGEILRDRPGITDPASLAFRDESALLCGENLESRYVSAILPRKLELSIAYARRRTFLSDVGIILRTLWAVITPGDTLRARAQGAGAQGAQAAMPPHGDRLPVNQRTGGSRP